MFDCSLPQTLRCSYRERIVSLLLRRHHWVMARHSTAGHSPLPKLYSPLLADPRSRTWTAVVTCLHTSSCDPHCGHAPPPTADTPLLAPILHTVRADRILRYSLLHELYDDESRVIAAPTCHTQYWLAPAAPVILLLGIGHHMADNLYCRITLSSTKRIQPLTMLHMWGQSPLHRSSTSTLRSTCRSCRRPSLLLSKSLLALPTDTPPPPPHLPPLTSLPFPASPAVPTFDLLTVSWPSTGASSVVSWQQYRVLAGWPRT